MQHKEPLEGPQTLPLVEQFPSLQGEGFYTGRAAWFIRLAGCLVHCPWCDSKASWIVTDYPQVSVQEMVEAAAASGTNFAVITGGEPLLHKLDALCAGLKAAGMTIALETSGTRPLSGVFDWICLSPKPYLAPLPEVYEAAHELKAVISQAADLDWALDQASRVSPSCRLSVQPNWENHRQVEPLLVDFVLRHPRWRLSLQTHKYLDIR